MKGIELFNALTKADEELIDRRAGATDGKKQKARSLRRIALAAACVTLAVCALAVYPLFRKSSGNPAVPIENRRIPFDAPVYFGEESSVEATGAAPQLNTNAISVTAKLAETLPDTYTFFDDWSQKEYRLLRMETVRLLKGRSMTDWFYYLIPAAYMTDLSLYDRFVIRDMWQCGYDYSVLYNKTQGKAEQLTQVLFYSNYMGQNFIPFDADGRFDGRLWQSWKIRHGDVPASLGQAEEREAGKNDSYSEKIYAHRLSNITGEAADVLSRIRSFENGVFVPKFYFMLHWISPEVQFRAVRYIGGFATNEAVRVWSREYTGAENDTFAETKAHFTDDDLANLPDLPSAIAAVALSFERGEIRPPHIENADELELASHGVFGWYAKTGEGVLGIVRVTWRYHGEKFLQAKLDDAYYIVDSASGQALPIGRDRLLDRLGEYETTYIFDGRYSANGKVYPVRPV